MGLHNVTINLHLLRHLAMAVKQLSPLWTQSAYCFEANNGVITKANTCTTNMLHQLYHENFHAKYYCNFQYKWNFAWKEINNWTQFDWKRDICRINVIINGVKFKSLRSRKVSTIDFFVLLNNNELGAVCFYAVHIDKMVLYALIEVHEILEIRDHFKYIKNTGIQKLFKSRDIIEKVIHLNFGQQTFITRFPNKFEQTWSIHKCVSLRNKNLFVFVCLVKMSVFLIIVYGIKSHQNCIINKKW